MIEDFDYQEQQALTELHILPDDFDNSGYYRMNEILAARSPEKRPVDPEKWLKSLGL